MEESIIAVPLMLERVEDERIWEWEIRFAKDLLYTNILFFCYVVRNIKIHITWIFINNKFNAFKYKPWFYTNLQGMKRMN